MVEAYTAGEKDYTALVSKMKAAGIHAFYLGGYHTEGALMIRQAHEMGYKPQLLSGDALSTDEFWKIAGNAGEGRADDLLARTPRKNPSAAPVVAAFKAQKYEPEGYTLYTYGAIQVWAAAVTKARLDRPCQGREGAAFGTVRYGARQDRLRQEGRRHRAPAMSGTSGARAHTTTQNNPVPLRHRSLKKSPAGNRRAFSLGSLPGTP